MTPGSSVLFVPVRRTTVDKALEDVKGPDSSQTHKRLRTPHMLCGLHY
jgi:uncharacterized membrane protein